MVSQESHGELRGCAYVVASCLQAEVAGRRSWRHRAADHTNQLQAARRTTLLRAEAHRKIPVVPFLAEAGTSLPVLALCLS